MFVTLSVLARIFSNSCANLYQKKASENDSSLVVNLFSYFIMSLICIVPACFVDWSQFGCEFWLTVFGAGMLCTIGTIALIEALKIGELSVLAPINSYKAIVGLISAFILLHELPSFKEFICVLLIVWGSYFVLNDSDEKFSFKVFLRRDIRLRLFALICSGVEASFLKKIILMSDFKISLILWCFFGFICSVLIFLFKRDTQVFSLSKPNYLNCSVIAIMLLVMQLTTNYVFSKMAVGTALSLFQLSSLVSLYFGYRVYNESNIKRKLLGTIIMIASAVVILW